MSVFNLAIFHAKRTMKRLDLMSLLLFFPLLFIFIFQGGDQSQLDLIAGDYLVLNQSDFVEDRLVEELPAAVLDQFVEDSNRAFAYLEDREIAVLFYIPPAYPDQPMTAYSLNGENADPIFEAEMAAAIAASVEKETLRNWGVNPDQLYVQSPEVDLQLAQSSPNHSLTFVAMMIMFYMLMAAGVLASDLNDLRASHVLKRSIAVNSNSWLVLGSPLLGYSLATLVYSYTAMVLGAWIEGVDIVDTLPLILLIFAMGVYVSGLTIFLFRYIRSKNIIGILTVILPILLIVLTFIEDLLPLLEGVEYLSPLYWLLDSLDTGQYTPHVPIVILMGLILFTAGSFKVERLVART